MQNISQEYELWVSRMLQMSPSFQQVGRAGYHPGMETMKALDAFLGHPHQQFRSIHVAGTNGKGSVSHMMASVFAAHGKKTGLYTSPHLADFRERIRINGIPISREAVVDFFRRTASFLEEYRPSFFEITTAMAWDYFAREGVEVALIEVGLGGRMDSTNLITPQLSIITSIGYDHCDLLGHTLPEIAAEKGGIIKPGVPVVLGNVQEELNPVFERLSQAVQAPLYHSQTASADRFAAAFPGEEMAIPDPSALDLQGEYQRANLKTVRAALRVLASEVMPEPSVWEPLLVRDALAHAAERTQFRGRWDRLFSQPDVYCDIAHNEAGLRFTMKQLQSAFEEGKKAGKYARLVLILGMVGDKEIDRVKDLFPVADYYFTQAPGPRAMPAEKLAGYFVEKARRCVVTLSVQEALIAYFSVAQPDDLVYIGGSSYVVAEALLHPIFAKSTKN